VLVVMRLISATDIFSDVHTQSTSHLGQNSLYHLVGIVALSLEQFMTTFYHFSHTFSFMMDASISGLSVCVFVVSILNVFFTMKIDCFLLRFLLSCTTQVRLKAWAIVACWIRQLTASMFPAFLTVGFNFPTTYAALYSLLSLVSSKFVSF